MIKYTLKCKNKHEFESWFLDSKEYEKLKSNKLIECSQCGTKTIEKSIMSPHVSNKDEKEKKTKTNNHLKKIREDLLKMRSFVEKNFEYVGKDFTNLDLLYKLYHIEELDKEFTFEILLYLESVDIEKSQRRLKAEYDKMKRK